jgi:3-(3-hydroxy-phenyl)propionate hydroxylase
MPAPGAGPIGLATACALAHHRVRFRIFERVHGTSGPSKCHNVIARARELLHAIGVRDALAKKASAVPFTQFLLDREAISIVSAMPGTSDLPHLGYDEDGEKRHNPQVVRRIARTLWGHRRC